MSGTLYIVATPIGNLQDITARALEVLRKAALVAAEDTRHSRRLLAHFGIDTPLLATHDHNERDRTDTLLERLHSGDDIALVSDAGTPLISDPGFFLVRAARSAGIRVVPVPGASALIAALSVAGLPTDRFRFEGFLPAKAAARHERLASLRDETVTLVFYESSHRIVASLEAMSGVLGAQRAATVARELTKTFETVHSGTLGELCDWIRADSDQQKGEFVVLVHGAVADTDAPDAHARHTLQVLLDELPLKQAASLAARITGQSKNRLYEYGLTLRS